MIYFCMKKNVTNQREVIILRKFRTIIIVGVK